MLHGFARLSASTKLVNKDTRHHELVGEWGWNRERFQLQIHDLRALEQAWRTARRGPPPDNPEITLVDRVPECRLAGTCEAVATSIYSMGEIAEFFMHRATNASP